MKTKILENDIIEMASDVFKAGIRAHADGINLIDCPHDYGHPKGDEWTLGYEAAIHDSLKNKDIISLARTHAQEIDRLIDRTLKILELMIRVKSETNPGDTAFSSIDEFTQANISEALQWAQNITYRATLRVLDGVTE